MSTPTIPGEVTYSRFYGTFLVARQDGPDDGTRPDPGYAAGTVTFTPSVERLIATVEQAVVWLEPVYSAPIAADGTFAIEVPATDAPGVIPTEWTYNVSVNVTGKKAWTFTTNAPAGADRNILSAVTWPSSAGTLITRGNDGVGVDSITDDDGDGVATITYSDATTSPLLLPPGPKGDAGLAGGKPLLFSASTFPTTGANQSISRARMSLGGEYFGTAEAPTTFVSFSIWSVGFKVMLRALQFHITTASSTPCSMGLGVYDMNGALVHDFGSADITTTGTKTLSLPTPVEMPSEFLVGMGVVSGQNTGGSMRQGCGTLFWGSNNWDGDNPVTSNRKSLGVSIPHTPGQPLPTQLPPITAAANSVAYIWFVPRP